MFRNTYFYLAVCTILALGGAGWYVVSLVGSSQQSLAMYLADELDTLPDERVPLALAQLSELGEPGLEQMVRALGHDRANVAQAANEALGVLVDKWREQGAAESSPRVAQLAHQLAARADGLTPAGRRQAALLADQLLDWPIDSESINGTRLVADCETVLRAANESVRVARSDPEQNRRDPRITAPDRTLGGSVDPLSIAPAESFTKPQPVARAPLLPVPTPQPALERELMPPAEPAKPPGEPGYFEPPIAPRLPRPAPLLPGGEPADEPPAEPTAATVDEASFLAPDPDSLPFSLLTDFAVMQALQAQTPERAAAAERELQRRGYSERNISLARRATDPDPVVRRELCDALAQSGPEARPWLRQLAVDNDTSVRLAAISVLSTGTDPETRAFLRDLKLKETEKPVLDTLKRSR